MLLSILQLSIIILIVLIVVLVFIFFPKKKKEMELIEEKTYTVSFVTNSLETLDNYIVEEGVILDILPSLKRSGYYFRGWCIDKDCKNLYNKKTPVTSDLVLYAKWQEQTMEEFLSDTNIEDFRKNIIKNIRTTYKERNENNDC